MTAMGQLLPTLRVITAGSVDDGKSTLIGRLLFDAKALTNDQLAMLQSIGDNPDFAALTDGLLAEKEQGITIDVAYRYFATEGRRYILADCPGHEQFTRNMVTGVSTADVAIVLIDPTKLDFSQTGLKLLLPQTKRHTALLFLLGVKHLMVAVNKMDLINYEQKKFLQIQAAYQEFIKYLNTNFMGQFFQKSVQSSMQQPIQSLAPELQIIPISALKGDNIVFSSKQLDWYQGQPLLKSLDQYQLPTTEHATGPAVFSIQYVLRPQGGSMMGQAAAGVAFRGYQGRLEQGRLQPGDHISLLPSGVKAKIKTIYDIDGQAITSATAGQVGQELLTLQFDREIEAARGSMLLGEANHEPSLMPIKQFYAYLCWFEQTALSPRRRYWLKHTTQKTDVLLQPLALFELERPEDFKPDELLVHNNQLDSVVPPPNVEKSVGMNSIVLVQCRLRQPLLVKNYQIHRRLGSFIIIDPDNHHTLAGGMVIG